MSLDAALLVFLAVMLYARIGLGRAVPLVAVLIGSATWALLLLAQLTAQIVGAMTRLGGLDPNTYYAAPSAIMEFFAIVGSGVYLLLGLALIAAVVLAFVMTPLPDRGQEATTLPGEKPPVAV